MHLRNANHALARLAAGILTSGLLVAATNAVADESNIVHLPNGPATYLTADVPGSTSSASSQLTSPAQSSLNQAMSQAGFKPSAAAMQSADSDDDSAVAGGTSNQAQADAPPRGFLSGVASKAGDVVVGALNLIGVRYHWGGNSPDSGLDCSGFVRYVFQDTLGFELPRRAVEMSHVGERVSVNDLKPGDLVFFDTVRRTISHVGIYIGHDKFVHSPSTGSSIRVDEMSNRYWETRFREARRVSATGSNAGDDDGGDIAARLQRATRQAY